MGINGDENGGGVGGAGCPKVDLLQTNDLRRFHEFVNAELNGISPSLSKIGHGLSRIEPSFSERWVTETT
jgi:hypothetical protein